ncbi:DUF4166 domain-containing protein [Maricaulis sp. W15]|uniref:DUF4166 domain-containing protein n=1 Tax=Maricaulis sp. W15 TaxID=1772333 RepID=UPI000AAFAEA8|nr:DUF4166 domain-containing protein [Maricaulis sp. W15]
MSHLYQALLGRDWDSLPAVTRLLHAPDPAILLEGHVDIERGGNPVAHLVAMLLGLPRAGAGQPALVRVSRDGDGELLERWYDGRHFATWQGREAGLLVERFGPFRLSFALAMDAGVLRFRQRDVALWGIALPQVLAPTIVASERGDVQSHRFDVMLRLPLLGQIIRYRGELRPAEE